MFDTGFNFGSVINLRALLGRSWDFLGPHDFSQACELGVVLGIVSELGKFEEEPLIDVVDVLGQDLGQLRRRRSPELVDQLTLRKLVGMHSGARRGGAPGHATTDLRRQPRRLRWSQHSHSNRSLNGVSSCIERSRSLP